MIENAIKAGHDDDVRTAMRTHAAAHDWRYDGGDPFALGTTSCGGIGAG